MNTPTPTASGSLAKARKEENHQTPGERVTARALPIPEDRRERWAHADVLTSQALDWLRNRPLTLMSYPTDWVLPLWQNP